MPETIPQARSLAGICDDVREANCGHCWQAPGLPCVTHPETGHDGYHVARFSRAMRRGLISGPELAAAIVPCSPATPIRRSATDTTRHSRAPGRG